jgi:hypothetical protein
VNWQRWALQQLQRLLEARTVEGQVNQADDVEDPETWLSLDYIHEQVQAQLELQSKDWEAVDARLRLILGVISIVFAAAAAFQRAASASGGAPLPFAVGATAILAVIFFLAAAVVATLAYWPSDFDRPPKPHELRELYLTTDPREVKLTVIDSILLAYTGNQEIIERKIIAFKRAFWLTAVASSLLGVALVVQVAYQTAAPPWSWWPFAQPGP